MIIRLALLSALAWAAGFAWFALMLPGSAGSTRTDGVVVLTGSRERIPRALEAVRKGWARRVLVSGVDKAVTPREFAKEYNVDRATLRCCVTLGYRATDTRSNALETARWVAANKVRSVRLVTTDWHMRRAAADLASVLPPGTVLVRDGVPGAIGWKALVNEYNKFLVRSLQIGTGL